MTAPLPPLVAKIAALIGQDQALALASHANAEGRRGNLYIPRRPRPGQCLVSLVGMDAAARLATAYGGTTINLPACKHFQKHTQRNADVRSMAAAGANARAIAQAFSLTVRQVRNVLAM